MLDLLLFPLPPSCGPTPPVPLMLDFEDSRSGLMFGLLSPFEGVKISLIFVPGDIPRNPLNPELILFLLDLDVYSGVLNVLAWRRAVAVFRAGSDSEAGSVAAVCG